MARSILMSRAAASCALALLLTACNAYKEPSEKNFSGAINGYYSEHNECLYPSALRFPYEVSANDQGSSTVKGLDALTDAGLLKRVEEKTIKVKRYSLTPFASTRVNGRFCYGHREVTSIDSFTPPAPVNGQQATKVTYHYKMLDVPGWAQSEQMRTAFPTLARNTTGQPQDTIQVVLTPNGWRVPE